MSDLRSQLVLHEGLKTELYRCTAGYLTIGVGHNIDSNGLPPLMRKWLDEHGSITHDMAMKLLDQDIAVCEAELDRYHPWWRTMSEIRQRVLLDMCFNMGIETLGTFKNTLKAMREMRYSDAADGMLKSKWATQVKGRAIRLAKMMKTGRDYA